MRANPDFIKLPKSFWAAVRTVSQQCGYTIRGQSTIKVPTKAAIQEAFKDLGLNAEQLELKEGQQYSLIEQLWRYFEYRAALLHNEVEPHLMDAAQAKVLFESLISSLSPKCPMPMNKQKGIMKTAAYLTGMVNMIIEANSAGHPVNYDPRVLTTVTKGGLPLRTLSRRVDGAFPSPINPIAIWEIKEYYYTTTFGSRVADGVYETLLDGMEIEELSQSEGIQVLHYLFLDARYTWWDCGKSYLCRIVDMLHMGYVDEVLVGSEVPKRLPELVKSWVSMVNGGNG